MADIFLDEVDDGASSESNSNIFLDEIGTPSPQLTREQRIAANNAAIATAQSQEDPTWADHLAEGAVEGLKGAGRAVKSIGQGFVGMASGATRLAGTVPRMFGYDALHKLADSIDAGYENFGADALESDYGFDKETNIGTVGEKMAGIAGSLGGLGAAGKAIGVAGKLAGGGKVATGVAKRLLPAMFGNDAAVRAYDTARMNDKSKGEAASLAALNGLIHYAGFRLFDNAWLSKTLRMGPETEAKLAQLTSEAMSAGTPKTYTELVDGIRKGIRNYTLAERAKGAIRAGGIMSVQDALSDIPMQVAEGKGWDDLDYNRIVEKGAHGLGEGGFMEGSMALAGMMLSGRSARKFVADKFYRGKDYKVAGPDGRTHDEPGILNSPAGRMFLMKQNPDATERVLDIVEHGGKPRADELDAAFLPPDMTADELEKFAKDWRKDLEPYVEEAYNADSSVRPQSRRAEADMDVANADENAGRILSAEEARAQGEQEQAQEPPQAQGEAGTGNVPPAPPSAPAGAEPPSATPTPPPAEPTARPQEQPTAQEAPNEAGNGAAEAPAQPEQGTEGRSAEGQAVQPVEAPAQGAEAPEQGVVEQVAQPAQAEAPKTGNKLRTQAEADAAKPVNKLTVQKLIARPDSQEKYDELKSRLSRPMKEGGVVPTSTKGKAVQAEIARMEQIGFGGAKPAEQEAPVAPTPAPTEAKVEESKPTAKTEEAKPDPAADRKYLEDIQKNEEKKGNTTAAETRAEILRKATDAEISELARLEREFDAIDAENHNDPRLEEIDNRAADIEDVILARPEPKATKAEPPNPAKPETKNSPVNLYTDDGDVAKAYAELVDAHYDAKQAPSGKEGVAARNRYAEARAKLKLLLKDSATEDLLETFNGTVGGRPPTARKGWLDFFGDDMSTFGTLIMEELASRGYKYNRKTGDMDAPKSAQPQPNIPKPQKSEAAKPGKPTAKPDKPVAKPDKPAQAAKAPKKPVQSAQAAQETPDQPAQEPRKGNRLRTQAEADAEKAAKKKAHDEKIRANRVAKAVKKVQSAAGNPGKLSLNELETLYNDERWHYSLGLGEAEANAVRDRVRSEYEMRYIGDNRNGRYPAAANAIREYESYRDSEDAPERDRLTKLAIAMKEAEKATKAAAEKKDETGLRILEQRLSQMEDDVSALDAETRGQYDAIRSRVEGQQSAMDKKKEALSKKAAKGEDTSEGRDKNVNDLYANEGNRLSKILGVDGDNVTIQTSNVQGTAKGGNVREVVTLTRDTLRLAASRRPEWKTLLDAVEERGEKAKGTSVRWSKGTQDELPEERAARFAADADYQRWLKLHKYNDAEPLRERYELEQADELAGMFKNAVGGAKVDVVSDRNYDPKKDNPDGGKEIADLDSGRIVGVFNRKTNELKLFKGANWKTLNHELGGHAIYKFAEQEAERGNRALLDKINEAIDAAPKWLKDDVRNRYAKGEGESDAAYEQRLRDEIFAAIRERPSKAMQDYVKTLQGRRWYNRAWDAIKTAWKGILARMGFNRADLSGIDRMKPEEFNDFLDRVMMEGKTLGRLEKAGGDGEREAFAGRTGAKRLGIGKFAVAERMEKDGASREDIWSKTGWWRGRDGKWRIEIPDAKFADETIGWIERARDGEAFELGSVVDAPELFKAYPDLEDLSLVVKKFNDGTRGEYDHGNGIISINKNMPIKAKRSTLIHELQHAVQAIEGFARGSSPDYEYDVLRDELGDRLDARKAEVAAATEYLMDIAKKNGFSDWLKRNKDSLGEEEISDEAKQLRAFMRSNLLHGKDLGAFRALLPQVENGSAEIESTMRKLGDEAYRRYRRIAGEVEARNAQTRRNYEELERGVIPPWETEDVPGSEQIVRMGDEGGAAADIRESRRATDDERGASGESSVREARAPRPAGYAILDDVQTKGEKAKEKIIDSLAPAQSVQDEIGGVKEVIRDPAHGGDGYTDHTKSTDVVAAKDKANGRIEYEMRDLQHEVDAQEAEVAKAALKGQTNEDLIADYNLLLVCEHAAERNRTHATENGATYTPDYYAGVGRVNYGGADVGFSENTANRIRADLQAKYGSKFQHLLDAAKMAYKMGEADLKRRLDAGLLSKADYDYYHDRVASGEWEHWVPLKTDLNRIGVEESDMSMAGSRLHRSEFRKASGRGETVAQLTPFTDIVLQREQGIRRAIANEVANVEANLVALAERRGLNSVTRTNPDGSTRKEYMFAEIVPGDDVMQHRKNYQFTFADGTSVMSEGSSHIVGNHPEIRLFKKDGRLYAIRYNKGANGRGLAYAKALSGENMGRWGNGLEWIPKFTHWMSAMRTQYSPEFTVSNLLADHLEAAQALVGRYGVVGGVAKFGKMVASEVSNFKDLRDYLRDGTIRGDVGKAILGGLLTKGGVASEGYEGKTQSIRSRIDEFRRNEKAWREMTPADMLKSGWKHAADFISFANELAEYSTRMGIFSALTKSGVPVNEAVKFARDATVNFNRKGTAMPYINGLYMFANASVQGAVRSVQAMTDVHGKQLVAALAALGVAKAVIDNFLGNDDDREKAGGRNARNLSEYDKKHNVGVPIGGGRQLVPLRFRGPYAAIPYLAQTAANVAMGNTSAKDGAKTLARELGDQVTDIVGGNGVINDKGEIDSSLFLQSVAPSVADPFVQWATGKDYKGEDRVKKTFDKTMPASHNGKRSTWSGYKAAAELINRWSLGNENRKGFADIAPENLQLIVEFLGGGPLRDLNNLLSTGQNVAQLASGGTPDKTLSQMPFVRRIVREYPESTSRYYDAIDRYEADKAEYKKTTEMGRRAALRRDKPYLSSSKTALDAQIERVKELTHLERGEVKVGQKWVEPKVERSEAQKERYRRQRLALQARILKRLGQ